MKLYTSNAAHLEETPTFVPESSGHKVIYSNLIGTGGAYDDFTFEGSVLTGWSEKGNETRLQNKTLVLPVQNPDTGEAITEIGENAFKIPDTEIEQLKDSVSSPNGMETVQLPRSLKEMGEEPFLNNAGVDGDNVVVCYTSNKAHLGFGNSNSHRIEYVPGTIGNFTDVSTDDWFYDSIEYVYEKGIMTGINDTTFAPYEALARAQFAVILHRLNGEPQMEYTDRFHDVGADIWYTDAILWASGQGVVTGYSNGNFGPGDYINREQMAVMMYRYAQQKGYNTSTQTDISGYPDAAYVSDFAVEAMRWAVGTGIITGTDNGTRLNPQGNANRAECATIIMRFCERYGIG